MTLYQNYSILEQIYEEGNFYAHYCLQVLRIHLKTIVKNESLQVQKGFGEVFFHKGLVILLEINVYAVTCFYMCVWYFRECASKAGFSVLRTINEPVAALLAYDLGQMDNTLQW